MKPQTAARGNPELVQKAAGPLAGRAAPGFASWPRGGSRLPRRCSVAHWLPAQSASPSRSFSCLSGTVPGKSHPRSPSSGSSEQSLGAAREPLQWRGPAPRSAGTVFLQNDLTAQGCPFPTDTGLWLCNRSRREMRSALDPTQEDVCSLFLGIFLRTLYFLLVVVMAITKS